MSFLCCNKAYQYYTIICFLFLASCNELKLFHFLNVKTIKENKSDNNLAYKKINILPNFQSPFPECGASINPTGSQIGGGNYYKNTVTKKTHMNVVTNVSQLLDAINKAHVADTIYLDDNSIFDVSACSPIKIKTSLTIASGRGKYFSDGALVINNNILFGDKNNPNSIFEIVHDSVRITGLRIQGPHPDMIFQKSNQAPQSCAIWFNSISYGVVDNCEIVFFYYSGIMATLSKNIYVHHNSIHHCHGKGLGYGVLVSRNSEALIEANLFECNRHDIAADGSTLVKYEARYNIIKTGSEKNQHSFDMHCIAESKYNCDSSHTVGGSTIVIYNNTWMDNRLTAIKIRGNPSIGCYVEKNLFVGYERETAVKTNPFVTNIFIEKNCYEKW